MFLSATIKRVFFAGALAFFFGAPSAFAATYEVVGWGWGADDNVTEWIDANGNGLKDAEEIGGLGWVSFSNKTDLTAIPYGVFIDGATGDFSGYAWSPNIGWITFNASDMQKCSTNLGDNNCATTGPNPKARVNITVDATGVINGGTGDVTGWARVCSVFVSGCFGTLRSSEETGGWDGWISLRGAGYGLHLDIPTKKFLGPTGTGPLASNPICATCFAWGGSLVEGFGWGMNLGGLGISLVSGSVLPSLSFWVDQSTLVIGQTATLYWRTSGNIKSCAATTPASWAGAKAFLPGATYASSVSPPTSQTYDLQCFGPDSTSSTDDTSIRTGDITVIPFALPLSGSCGTGGGPSSNMRTTDLCSVGALVDPPGVVANDIVKKWEWTCSGTNGGAQSPLCTTDKLRKIPEYKPF